ncbi:MAG TPA: hypothetical protein VGM93_04640 [Acidimicrobiales bacterium]
MDLTTEQHPRLRSWDLRYFLTLTIAERGVTTVRELVAALDREGFAVAGRPSKTISDTLRHEVAKGRVIRVARGRYARGWIPRSTEYRMRQRVMAYRDRAA